MQGCHCLQRILVIKINVSSLLILCDTIPCVFMHPLLATPFSTVALFARPSSHVSSKSYESSLPLSPSRMGPDQSGTPHSSESSSVTEATRNPPTSPSSLVVKEEPCDMATVFIKWEMSEEGLGEHQESVGAPCQEKESPSEKSNVSYLFLFLIYIIHCPMLH